MDKLLKDLEAVALLAEKATPGEWRTDYRKTTRGYAQEVFDADGATIATMAWHAVPLNDTTTTTDREYSAQFVVALVNWYRTHHAEIAAAVRDAKAYRQLVAGIDAEQLVAASEKHGDALGVLKDAARYRYIRSAPAGTVRADFHSWAPSYHHWGNGKSLDESIDAAMRAGEGEG